MGKSTSLVQRRAFHRTELNFGRRSYRELLPEQYTSWQIARRLNATGHLREYLFAAERHALAALIHTYRVARVAQDSHRAFIELLNH